MLIPDKGNQNWFKRLAAGSGRLAYVTCVQTVVNTVNTGY